MMRLRLLPVLIFALACLLALKTNDLLGGFGVEVDGPVAAYAGDGFGRVITNARAMPTDVTGSLGGKKAEAPAEAAPAADGPKPETLVQTEAAVPPPAIQPAETAEPLIPLATASPAERAILERLQQRRQQLDQQGRDLDMRENLLKAAEKRIEDRVEELKKLEASIGATEQKQADADKARAKNLVVMYEAMKPKDAARIFNRLDMAVLLDVASAMKPTKIADILAAMDSDAAQRLTVALATKDVQKPATDGQPVTDLPKIEGQPPKG